MENYQYGNMFESDKYVRQRFAVYQSLLGPYLKKDVKILDIGCYSADILTVLPKFVDYYGIDSDAQALAIAEKRGAKTFNFNFEQGELPIKEPFDIIIMAELLEHLKDPERILIQAVRLLKEGGVVLISLPNECTLYHRIKVLFGKGIDGTGFAPHYHLHFPTIRQHEDFITSHFKIMEKRYWFHLGGGKAEKFLSVLPEAFWRWLVNTRPSLFARGGIYLCQK